MELIKILSRWNGIVNMIAIWCLLLAYTLDRVNNETLKKMWNKIIYRSSREFRLLSPVEAVPATAIQRTLANNNNEWASRRTVLCRTAWFLQCLVISMHLCYWTRSIDLWQLKFFWSAGNLTLLSFFYLRYC